MGLFGLFKKNSDVDKQISDIISVTGKDFDLISHNSKVLGVKISEDFNELFADFIVDKSMKSGDTLEFDFYTTKLVIWKNYVEVIFPSIQTEKLIESIDNVNEKLNWIVKNKNLIDSKITNELLNLKNTNWLKANHQPVTNESLLKSIYLKSIVFINKSVAELNYDDGNIFSGHDITVELNATNEITKVKI